MKVLIRPKKLKGQINVVPSKSYSHRAIIAASLAHGTSVIKNVMYSNDIIRTIECCRAFGADIIEHDNYYSNDVLDVINDNPFIVLTTACHTNAFDQAEPCLSEAFIRRETGGAVAYWGSSRYGWNGISDELNELFFKSLFSNESHHFSRLVKNVQLRYGFIADDSPYYRWLLLSNNAIGDAELPIYTTIPNKFENVTIEDNGTTLTVNTGGIDSCTITISNVANGGTYYVTDTNISSAIFTSVPSDYTIVITKDNHIPYIYDSNAPQPICHITNEIINDERVIIGCEETRIGGYPIIDIEAQTSGEVKITNTGSLEVINGGTVNIEHLTMEEGAELKIH